MSKSRARGTAWETEIVNYLNRVGYPYVERRALNGAADKGDIAGLPGVVIEAKSQNRFTLAEWMDETIRQGHNASAEVAVCWIHRPGKASARDGYVVMNGAQFIEILGLLGYTPAEGHTPVPHPDEPTVGEES